MGMTHKLAVVAVRRALGASGSPLTQLSSDKASSRADEPISPTSPPSSDVTAIKVATRARRPQMCLDRLHNDSPYAKYRAAAHCQTVVSIP